MKKTGLCGHNTTIKAVRGCCVRCYNNYQRRVKAGEVTWEALETEGKVAKVQPRWRQWGRIYFGRQK